MKPGPTGAFPQGKVSPDDDGELVLAVTANHRQQIIEIDFGAPVAWIGISKQDALDLLALLMEKLAELD